MMTRYVHTDIIARNRRDLRGEWLDRLTGAHIVGETLRLPGYDEDHPTLEIFSYDRMSGGQSRPINAYGIAHLAFEVDDVAATPERVLAAGGGKIGELVHAEYEDGRRATFVYATDPEGNILELQSWS